MIWYSRLNSIKTITKCLQKIRNIRGNSIKFQCSYTFFIAMYKNLIHMTRLEFLVKELNIGISISEIFARLGPSVNRHFLEATRWRGKIECVEGDAESAKTILL
jgi:hypothetical protein